MRFSPRSLTRPLLAAALLALVGVPGAALGASPDTGSAATQVGTLQVERHGDRGRPVILIPGLEGGTWVWKDTIAHLQRDHVVYAVTLAGFDGVPAPAGGQLFDQANASLLRLIREHKLDKPVLVGHSLGGTLALHLAGEHAALLGGVVAVDGLPVFPGMERVDAAQRATMAAQMQAQMAAMTPEQFAAQARGYMQNVGVLDAQLAARLAALNARSDVKASAQYMAEVLAFDGRAGLRQADLPILEISPYNAADYTHPPMVMSEAQKTAYYRGLLAGAPNAKVVSISPARHYVMFDQPVKFQQTLDAFLQSL
jgi:pimeloyl-ACP methyl ester carboxylesterase